MNNSNENLLKAQKKCSEGNIFFDKKIFQDAIECYDRAIELKPNYFQAYFNKGYLKYKYITF